MIEALFASILGLAFLVPEEEQQSLDDVAARLWVLWDRLTWLHDKVLRPSDRAGGTPELPPSWTWMTWEDTARARRVFCWTNEQTNRTEFAAGGVGLFQKMPDPLFRAPPFFDDPRFGPPLGLSDSSGSLYVNYPAYNSTNMRMLLVEVLADVVAAFRTAGFDKSIAPHRRLEEGGDRDLPADFEDLLVGLDSFVEVARSLPGPFGKIGPRYNPLVHQYRKLEASHMMGTNVIWALMMEICNGALVPRHGWELSGHAFYVIKRAAGEIGRLEARSADSLSFAMNRALTRFGRRFEEIMLRWELENLG